MDNLLRLRLDIKSDFGPLFLQSVQSIILIDHLSSPSIPCHSTYQITTISSAKVPKIPKVFLPPGICFKLLPPFANKSLLLGKTFRLISFRNKKKEEYFRGVPRGRGGSKAGPT